MTAEASGARLLVVDDDPIFLGIVDKWLTHAGYQVRTARGGLEAITLAQREVFDVIVTDLRMPDLSGLQLLGVLKELRPEAPIIFLSGEGTMEEAIEALRFGRSFDFLRKPLKNLYHLNFAIETALEQRGKLPSDKHPPQPGAMPSLAKGELSEREREVLRLAAEGFDNKGIGERLCLSDKTVRNHLSRIYQKLSVTNRMQAVMRCKEKGII